MARRIELDSTVFQVPIFPRMATGLIFFTFFFLFLFLFVAVLGGVIGGSLAANNYIGKGVHVPDIPEASNRIIVDFAEALLRKMDIGFVATVSAEDDPTYKPTRGVMAAVDTQLRNSKSSVQGVRTVPNLPAHMHIKNMEVHGFMRRQGVGQALLDRIEAYAKEETDAQALTLYVKVMTRTWNVQDLCDENFFASTHVD
jgi:GNAT superfamily N-acetyltransferase